MVDLHWKSLPFQKESTLSLCDNRNECEDSNANVGVAKRNRVDSVEEIEQAAINHVVMNKKGRGRV